MASTIASRKAKGRNLQNEVCALFAQTYGLEHGVDKDLASRPMGNIGTDIIMSKRAKELIPFDIECKNQEAWNVPVWFEQAVSNTEKNRMSLLIAKKNRSEVLAILKLTDLLKLLALPKKKISNTDGIIAILEKTVNDLKSLS